MAPQAYSHQNYADIARSIIGLSLLFSYVTILCYFGDKVNSAFDAVNYSIYQCSWNEFPRNMQTVLVTFQINAQKVVHIKGLMNLQCSREVLKKVHFASSFLCFHDILICFFVFLSFSSDRKWIVEFF